MIKNMLKIFSVILSIYLLLALGFIVYAQMVKLDSYEIKNQSDKDINLDIVYNESTIETEKQDNDNLNNFINCYKVAIKKEDFSVDLLHKYNEIEDFFKNNSSVSFTYEDLYTGLHISYNEKQNFFTASVIKSPVVTYIYNLYANKQVDLKEILTYQQNHYVEGSGSIQFQPFGSQYTIGELIEKAIVESDNIAYQMLAYRFYDSGIMSYYRNLGASSFWSGNSIWGQINSHDGSIYMKELYKFTVSHPELSDQILNYHFKSVKRLIKLENKSIKIAHKSGWNSATIHDATLIYDKQPYVLAITTLKGYDDYDSFFYKASNLINEFHKLYWSQKASYCYYKTFK